MIPTPLRIAFATILALAPAMAYAVVPAHAIRIGQDVSEWRRSADSLRSSGYRPISLDADGDLRHPRLATVWTRASGPGWALLKPTASEVFGDSLAAWRAKGYRPTAIAALDPDTAREGSGSAAFAALLIKDGPATVARFDLDQAGFQAACDSARQSGAKCDWIETYGAPGHPRFAAVFVRDSAGTPWNYSLGDDSASFAAKRNIFARVWVRPARIAPMPGGRFATVWEENSAGAQDFRPNVDAAALAQIPADGGGLGLIALRTLPGASGRFAASFAEHDAPLARAFTVTGPEAPGLDAFDGYMRALMKGRGVRAGALAIAHDARLVFAHGYTWGEPGYPVTQPNSLFRAASCSKPLTSILVHRLLREGDKREGPSLKEKILALLRGGHEPADVPADPRFGEITVDQLLTHSAGWARSPTHPDPVFNDYPPGSEIRKRLPASRGGFLEYMLHQPLQFAPGSKSVYDNFGYFLLGRLIESLPMGVGKSYQAIAGDMLFKPLGLSRPRFGGSRYEDRAQGEVLYHTAVPYLQADPSGNQPWVPGAYGDFEVGNMDAAGAWLLSAPDYAKVLAAFDLGASNPILGPQATATMWGPSGFSEALRGWFALKLPNANGDTVVAKWHNGLFPGSSTLVFYHPEKWSFVMFLDRDLSPQPDGPHEGKELAKLASAVKAWPAADLFPAMGIPSFRQPAIGPEKPETAAGNAEEGTTLAGDPK